jgi:hypothetical protein
MNSFKGRFFKYRKGMDRSAFSRSGTAARLPMLVGARENPETSLMAFRMKATGLRRFDELAI